MKMLEHTSNGLKMITVSKKKVGKSLPLGCSHDKSAGSLVLSTVASLLKL